MADDMTNAEVLALKAGDRVTLYDYDRVRKARVRTGTIIHIQERRHGAFPISGKDEWAIVQTADDTFVIESDSYIEEFGYNTHEDKKRIRGAEFAQQIPYGGGMFAGLPPFGLQKKP